MPQKTPEILYYFKSKNCAPCKSSSKTVDEYVSNSLSLKTVVIDIEDIDAFEYSAMFRVRSLPCIIVVDKQNEVINRFDSVSEINIKNLLAL